jgi:small-conductance mechanosensitive channel/CRP-like cAMP-binding protein
MQSFSDILETLTSGEAWSFSGLGLLVALLLIGGLRLALPRSEHRRIRTPIGLLVGYVVFVAFTALSVEGTAAYRSFRVMALLLLLVCIGRSGFLLVIDAVLVRRFSRPIPKIFRDIMEGLVYTAAMLIVLRQAGAQIDALLTTSALLTAVIGLSMQDTLGNLFAGLSLQAQNPFEVGDWIQYDENPELVGRVVEINWRATRIITLDRIEVVIPNGPLARAPLRNFTKPSPLSRRAIYVVVPRHEAPHRVHQAILESLRDAPGVMTQPPPSVVTHRFTERGISYWVRYFTADFEAREVTDGLVRDRIWYALRRANIDLAIPVHDVAVTQDDESTRERERADAVARRKAMLRNIDFCRALPDDQLERLAQYARERPYAPGELVIRAGEAGDELFIVQQGELAVLMGEGTPDEVEVARLCPGSVFGEMSVMTGAPRSATVCTIGTAQMLVLDKAAFKSLLDDSPQLAERISEILALRQEQLDNASSRTNTPVLCETRRSERSGQLLGRIKEFFSLSH